MNICGKCGKKFEDEAHEICLSCRKVASERVTRRRNARLAKGLCPNCGGERDLPEKFVLCYKCRMRSKVNNIKYRKRLEGGEQLRVYEKCNADKGN